MVDDEDEHEHELVYYNNILVLAFSQSQHNPKNRLPVIVFAATANIFSACVHLTNPVLSLVSDFS